MRFTEQEVLIPSKFMLAGTLTIPQGDEETYPVVVMVHGSGKVDRNEDAKNLRINAFAELSSLAAEQGFATLRYDKRGIGKSGGNYYETGLFDLIEDAVSVVEFARQHPRINSEKIILLGHSEGCLIVPAVNQKVQVQGMILIAGSAEPLSMTTAWQREQLIEDMRAEKGFSGWLIRPLKVDKKIVEMNEELVQKITETDKAVIRYKGKKVNAKWNREHHGYDVRELLKDVTCPVLAITGTKDVQVKPEQVKEICDLVQGECKYHLIEDMTHILRKTDAEHRIGVILKDYKKQVKRPVDQELKEIIKGWLNKYSQLPN
ncbi:hypothetical protein PB1_12979 [Bacillus methanolicus PB1]|uniref:Serine aminopeptidase S33 domain-containing protein n=1 Tax=Bacillus methanolicus PB1 TaxID=997296 RepID=I3DW51_BACMT|nr:alpha/beta fold hydrolase [Bacillus methanolicus]EIJ78472.1 hypothetical protein PB1_12979 [Bacillus methanolicus PB1]